MIRMRLLLPLLLFAVPSFAQPSSPLPHRGRAAVARVIRFDALPRVTGQPSQSPVGIEEGEVPMGEEAMEELKRQPGPDARRLPRVTIDRRATGSALEPLAPVTGVTFEGITQGRYIP